MDNKSLEILEFPRILGMLAGFTSFSASRELAATLKPLSDREQISLLLRQVAEARQLLTLDPGPECTGQNFRASLVPETFS